MSGKRSALCLHLLGMLGFAGWLGLTAASHTIQRPLLLFLGVLAVEWLIFLAAWRLAAKRPAQVLQSLRLWAPAFLLCAFFAAPLMEDDHFRFLWDGRQFAMTGNPYAVAPASSFGDTRLPERFQEILDNVNYPHVPTIYGPVTQLGFLLSYWVAPGQLWPWKLLLCVTQLVLLFVVLHIVRQRQHESIDALIAEKSVKAALVVGWCPLLVFETGFNAHPDILGVALLSAALLCVARRRRALTGILCGLAVASKLFALPIVPFLLVRSGKAWLAFLATCLFAYAPFWLQGSAGELAGLAIFTGGWEFNSSLYALAKWAFGSSPAKALCGLLFATIWLLVLRKWIARTADSLVPPGAAIYAALLLLSATVNPWYLLWIAPFVALRPSATALVGMAVVSLSYITGLNLGAAPLDNFEHPGWVRLVEYGALALTALLERWRWHASSATAPQLSMSTVD